MLTEHREHLWRGKVLEARPAQVVKRAAFGVVAGRVEPQRRGLEALGLVLFAHLVAVEAAQKQQVGDLLDDFKRVGDAARPEGVPDLVDFVFQFTGKHGAGQGCRGSVRVCHGPVAAHVCQPVLSKK